LPQSHNPSRLGAIHAFCMKILLIALLCCAASLTAQSNFLDLADARTRGDFGQVYRINPARAVALAQYANRQPKPAQASPLWERLADELLDQAPVDTFHGTRPARQLPLGTYVAVYAEEEDLHMQIINNHSFSLYVVPNPRALEIVLHDSVGAPITDAQLTLDGEPLRYVSKTKGFQLPKRRHGGLLTVRVGDELMLQDVQEEINDSRNHFRKRKQWYKNSRGIGRLRYYPQRWYIISKRVVFHPFSRSTKYFLSNLKQQKLAKKGQKGAFHGYIAFSKTKYQPGDTLKVTAYITDRKGRPRKRPLRFHVEQSGQKYFQTTLSPIQPGRFLFERTLGDSLTLDKQYTAWFFDDKVRPKYRRNDMDWMSLQRFVSSNFKYEDYELEEAKYSIRTAGTGPYDSRSDVQVILTAMDANGQALPAIDVHLVLVPGSVGPRHQSHVYVPDTLWQRRQPLSGDKTTIISIPSSVWPEADLQVTAKAWFVSASGEQQQESCSFYVNKENKVQLPQLHGELSADGVARVFWKNTTQNPTDSADLVLAFASGRKQKMRVKLPFMQRIPTSVHHLRASAGGQAYSTDIYASSVSPYFERQGDSVTCRIENPLRLQVRYLLKEDGKTLLSGTMNDSLWRWVSPGRQQHRYEIEAWHQEGGKQKYQQDEIAFLENQLQIDVQQPEQVRPGETTQVRIRVEDARRRPAPGTALSAVSINAQLDAGMPVSTPEVPQRVPRSDFQYGRFSLGTTSVQGWKSKVSLWRAVRPKGWYTRLGLSGALYYRLRFEPDSGRFYVSKRTYPACDSTDYRRPQFSPFVIHKGHALPVHLIHCNKYLLYSSLSTDAQPYSFFADKGANEIVLRTANSEFVLSGLQMDYGDKLDFAFVVDDYKRTWSVLDTSSKLRFDVAQTWRPDTLTAHEQVLLRKTMLLWKPKAADQDGHYFWQGRHNIHFAKPSGRQIEVIGPFDSHGKEISCLRRCAFLRPLDFEPGFTYEIEATRERLFASSWPSNAGKLSYRAVRQLPGALAYNHLQIDHGKKKARTDVVLRDFEKNGSDAPGTASLRWAANMPKDTLLWAIALKGGQQIKGPYSPSTMRLDGLPPGGYELIFYTQKEYLLRVPLQLRKDSTLYLRLDSLRFVPSPVGSRLGDLFRLDSADVTIKSPLPSTFDQLVGNYGVRAALSGRVSDKQEALIGASVAIYQDGIFVRGAVTDFDGYFKLNLQPGVYDITVSYTGYVTQQMQGVIVPGTVPEIIDIVMDESSQLSEVLITAYSVPLIERDRTSAGHTLTSVSISNLPTRNVSATVALEGMPELARLEEEAKEEEGEVSAVRKKFADNAFWQPMLMTDARGEAAFQVTFPDNITTWNTYVVGVDRRKRAGLGAASTKAILPLSAQLSLPRFAVAGDRFSVCGLLRNSATDSVDVLTKFTKNGVVLREKSQKVGAGLAEYAEIGVPQQGDSLHVSYSLQSAVQDDGEQRSIAVLPVGVPEVSGAFWHIERDTLLTFLPQQGKGEVLLYAEDNVLDLLFEDVRYLANYPYGCNEQTSSRLLALLLAKDIARYRPTAQVPKVDAEIKKCLARLQKNQNLDGSWGWWADNERDPWMTIYVLRALCKAKQAGHPSKALDSGLSWLRTNLNGLPVNNLGEALQVLMECGVNVDCRPFRDKIAAMLPSGLYQNLVGLRVAQLCGLTLVRDSLEKHLRPTSYGGLTCGTEGYDWYNRRATSTLLAYDIAEAAQWKDLTKKIRRYWLHSRSAQQRNTIEAAQILVRLLPHYLHDEQHGTPVFTVNGEAISKFPLRMTLPADQPLQLRLTGQQSFFVTAYQRWHNPQPTASDTTYTLSSSLHQRGQTSQDDALRRGEPAELRVKIDARAQSEYVMVEVPIPAGCSYGEKTQPSYLYNSHEVHREYFRDRVVIFYRRLPIGSHELRIALEPRFTGQYTLNPARAEQMYFPVFRGHDVVKSVRVFE
jgi:alpha-2-macroglobulin